MDKICKQEVFYTGEFDVVLMELDGEGRFLSEVDKFALDDGVFVHTLCAIQKDGVWHSRLVLFMPGDYKDADYFKIMEAYNFELYDDIESVLTIDEVEAYEPMWELTFIHTSYEKTKELLEDVLNRHKNEIERVKQLV